MYCTAHGIKRTKIFPVVLCKFETSSLTLWERHRLRLFKNRVLREAVGPQRERVTGD